MALQTPGRAGPHWSSSGINVIRGMAMDAPEAGQFRALGDGHGAGPAGPRPVDPDHALRPPPPSVARPRPLRPLLRARLHPPVRHAAPDRLRPDARGHRASSASGAAGRRATPSTATPPAIEVTTGPLGQGVGQRGRHGPRRAHAAHPLRQRVCDHRTFVDRGRRLLRWRASRTRRPRWRGTSAWAGCSPSTTTTTSRSTGRPSWPTATAWPSASRPTAGEVRDLGEMANDVDGLERPSARRSTSADGPDAKPTLLVLRSHIGGPPASSPTRPRRTAPPSVPRRSASPRRSWACPRTRLSGCPTRCASSTPTDGAGRRDTPSGPPARGLGGDRAPGMPPRPGTDGRLGNRPPSLRGRGRKLATAMPSTSASTPRSDGTRAWWPAPPT